MRLGAFDKWERTIKQNTNNWKIQQHMHLKAVDSSGVKVLEQLSQPEFFKDALAEFTKKEFLGAGGVLTTEFHKRSDQGDEYFPHFLSRYDREGAPRPAGKRQGHQDIEDTRKARTQKKHINMANGFAALWSAISQKPVFTVKGTEAVAQIGPWSAVGSLRLNEYMGGSGAHQTNSSLNNLFLATEYGTGVAGNVGSPGFVRHNGPSKNQDGSWWFGIDHGLGGLFTGQKGFHFLYDERTRIPRDIYIDRVRKLFPEYIQKKLSKSITLA